MKLFWVRHGLTSYNLPEAEEANPDPMYGYLREFDANDLTPQGQLQAMQTGMRLKDIRMDRVLVSPAARTFITAANVVKQQKVLPELEVWHELYEVGAYGMSTPMPLDVMKTVWQNIKLNTDGYETTGRTETDEERADRADRVRDRILREFSDLENVLVVTHGHFLSGYLIPSLMMIPRELRGKYVFFAENAAIGCIEYKDDGRIVVRSVNDCGYMGSNVSREFYTIK